MNAHEILELWDNTRHKHAGECWDSLALTFAGGVARTVQEKCARVCDDYCIHATFTAAAVAHELAHRIRSVSFD